MGLIQVLACDNTRGPAMRLMSPRMVKARMKLFLIFLSLTATPEDMLELSEIIVERLVWAVMIVVAMASSRKFSTTARTLGHFRDSDWLDTLCDA